MQRAASFSVRGPFALAPTFPGIRGGVRPGPGNAQEFGLPKAGIPASTSILFPGQGHDPVTLVPAWQQPSRNSAALLRGFAR